MASSLRAFLKPRTVAIIGASRDPAKRGHRAIQALLNSRFEGRIVPINPKEPEILSLPCFPDIAAVPFEIDLALVCTPSRSTPEVIRACGEKGVKGAVVLAGGFGEASPEGAELEARTVEVARRYGVRLVGPNTNGIFDGHTGLNLVGWPGVYRGSLGVLSQSGNVAMSLMTTSIRTEHAGFTTFIGVGNESDIRFDEYLRFFGEDEATRAVIAYVEGFKDGRAFLDAAREVTRRKPVVLYKAGRTGQGQGAARSHSGSLAGDYAVGKGAMRQAGIIVLERSDEMFPVADMLSRHASRPAARVAVLSEGGGVISQAADALAERGLSMPALAAATEAALKAITPNATQLSNPIDAGGATDPHPRYIAASSRVILGDPSVDALLIVGFFGGYQVRYGASAIADENKAAQELVAMAAEAGKPVIVQSHYADFPTEAITILREAGILVVRSIEIAAACLAGVAEYHSILQRAPAPARAPAGPVPEVCEIIAGARAGGRTSLLEPEALRLLAAAGMPVPPHAVLRSVADVAELGSDFKREEVALKVVSKDILHKSDVGGVLLGLRGEAAIAGGMAAVLAEVRRRRPEAEVAGVLVTPMARRGVEVIVGVTTDPQYGRIMMFGLGGVFVEVLKDVAFRALPLTPADAAEMLDEIKGRAILDGVRGKQGADRRQIVDLMLRLSDIAVAHPEITEIDLNPVILHAEGYAIVDARMLLA
ncbi:acetate--CoA ligase family protein [Arenibaculum sp.]|jgi:acetyltransferase|uniref:acetate--CoA ligase family protein n=1 Tax=Arenibaculum sp. TaxID=2865862 RepID=UPI002E1001BC|nr:acetate--CoA ligase family protein [Arenibaculum sp.]